jgi:hypothetical protein
MQIVAMRIITNIGIATQTPTISPSETDLALDLILVAVVVDVTAA